VIARLASEPSRAVPVPTIPEFLGRYPNSSDDLEPLFEPNLRGRMIAQMVRDRSPATWAYPGLGLGALGVLEKVLACWACSMGVLGSAGGRAGVLGVLACSM
jgi:hypothetical protein